MASISSAKHHAPSLIWTLLEGRALIELGWFYSLSPILKRLPKGDGHPVIVFPGFMAGKLSTRPMRRILRKQGYMTYDWGLGHNIKFNAEREADMHALIERVYEKHGEKISLVGWSLGGVFAREMAKAFPNHIRQVISLGSPISDPLHSTHVNVLFEAINGQPSPETQERIANLPHPLPVPSTSVYTKTDGVVHWQGSLQDTAPNAENIEVPASHTGLGVNPLVMYILADRLAQTEAEWQPFDMRGFMRLLFKAPDPK